MISLRPVERTDLVVSRLALGTMHLGGSWDSTPVGSSEVNRAASLLDAAMDLGINHLDLADIYTLGKSESVIGDVLRQRPGLRDRLVLQGKCGIVLDIDPDLGPPKRYDSSRRHITRSVESSLRRLGTDRLDLLAVHRPDLLGEPEVVAETFESLHRDGKVRYFGVSNHGIQQIERLRHHLDRPLVVNQLELSLAHPGLISSGAYVNHPRAKDVQTGGLLDDCLRHRMLVQAWSPLGGGRLTGERRDDPLVDALAELADERGVAPAAVALAWILRHPGGIQPVLGTRQPERLVQCAAAESVAMDRPTWYRLLELAEGAALP